MQKPEEQTKATLMRGKKIIFAILAGVPCEVDYTHATLEQ